MKIAFVIPSLQPGGMERVMSELILVMSNQVDVELHLVLYGFKRDIFYPIPKEVIVHRPSFRFNNKIRFISTIRTIYFLRSRLKKIQPDTLLSFGELWNNFVLLALLGTKIPVYVSDRSQPDKSLGKIHNNLRRWLYPRSAGIIAQTQTAEKIYKKQFHHTNFRVIGNPIKEIVRNQNSKRKNIVLTVGRLITTKHHDRLIRIFAAINDPNWKLIIIGGDALKQSNSVKLERLIADLKMENRIKLTGTIHNVEDYYLKSKIFAFTSSSEGFPNVVGEALSAGLPVVSYDCIAGPSEMIVDGENGYLVDVFDDKSFQKRLRKLMKNQKLREEMSEVAKKSVLTYNTKKIGEEFYNFITSLS